MRESHGLSLRSAGWFVLVGLAAVLGVVSATLVLSRQDAVAPPGAGSGVSWATLARVAHWRVNGHIEHSFDRTVASLDGAVVELSGFMVPFELGETHTRFLLSASPRTCFGCWFPGPEGWVEILAASPFDDTYDRITVSGHFSILRDDSDWLHYRITDAVRVAGKHG
jgi:hypothetical protein